MHRTDLLMDGTIQPGGRPVILRSERFRQPFPFERRLGLWVDRIGINSNFNKKWKKINHCYQL